MMRPEWCGLGWCWCNIAGRSGPGRSIGRRQRRWHWRRSLLKLRSRTSKQPVSSRRSRIDGACRAHRAQRAGASAYYVLFSLPAGEVGTGRFTNWVLDTQELGKRTYYEGISAAWQPSKSRRTTASTVRSPSCGRGPRSQHAREIRHPMAVGWRQHQVRHAFWFSQRCDWPGQGDRLVGAGEIDLPFCCGRSSLSLREGQGEDGAGACLSPE